MAIFKAPMASAEANARYARGEISKILVFNEGPLKGCQFLLERVAGRDLVTHILVERTNPLEKQATIDVGDLCGIPLNPQLPLSLLKSIPISEGIIKA